MEKILNKTDVEQISSLLLNGEVIALPTDTIYGFSCMPNNSSAVKKLCELKHCDEEKMFIILVHKDFDLSKLLILDDFSKNFIKQNTPNPLTMIVNKKDDIGFCENFKIPTLAVRIPDDDFLQQILSKVGFMISTSCNLHGEPNLNNMEEIISTFKDLKYIVKTDAKKQGKASTIVDLTNQPIKVLRQGDYQVK